METTALMKAMTSLESHWVNDVCILNDSMRVQKGSGCVRKQWMESACGLNCSLLLLFVSKIKLIV